MKDTDKRTCDFHVRMTEDERAELDAIAEDAGMTRSELVRLLAKLPARDIAKGNIHLVAVDRATISRIHREMRRFGTNLNQATHALNSINFYMKHGSLRYEYLDFALPEIKENLALVKERQQQVCKDMSTLESSVLVGF